MAAEWLRTNTSAVVGELIRILPDALVIMPGFFSILTVSYPQFVLFMSLIESVGLYYLLSNLVFTDFSKVAFSDKCKTGFRSATFSSLSLFKGDTSAFPSAPLYMTSVAAAYLFNSLSSQMKELESLGPQYALRFYLSIIALCLVLFFIGSYRISNGCESMLLSIASIALGLVVGSLLIIQNNSLFGPNSTNLSGIPLLRNKTATGEQIYICTQGSPK